MSGSDRAAEIIRAGDMMAVLRMALQARAAYERGEVCECSEPILHGRDLMCGACLLENEGQRDRLEALIRGPHVFEPNRRGGSMARFCQICSFLDTDERHTEPSP